MKMNLAVEIVKFVDAHQPGWVESQFADANGVRHKIIDKVPTFTAKPLEESSRYPQPGSAPCEVLAQWQDDGKRKLVRIATPGIESTDGLSEFIVLFNQLHAAPI
jgi:hypothetical protein